MPRSSGASLPGVTDREDARVPDPAAGRRCAGCATACARRGSRTAASFWTVSRSDITERKLAGEALRESEARFRSLTELSSDWYWEQDENLRFTYLSSRANDLTGYSGESSIGKTRWELVNMTPLSCSWPEHQAVLAARQPFRDLECRRIGPDGRIRYLSMSGAPIFDEEGRFKGYQGIGRDITERKRAEEALLVAQEMLDSRRWRRATKALRLAHRREGRRERGRSDAQELFGLPPGVLRRHAWSGWKKLAFHPTTETCRR